MREIRTSSSMRAWGKRTVGETRRDEDAKAPRRSRRRQTRTVPRLHAASPFLGCLRPVHQRTPAFLRRSALNEEYGGVVSAIKRRKLDEPVTPRWQIGRTVPQRSRDLGVGNSMGQPVGAKQEEIALVGRETAQINFDVSRPKATNDLLRCSCQIELNRLPHFIGAGGLTHVLGPEHMIERETCEATASEPVGTTLPDVRDCGPAGHEPSHGEEQLRGSRGRSASAGAATSRRRRRPGRCTAGASSRVHLERGVELVSPLVNVVGIAITSAPGPLHLDWPGAPLIIVCRRRCWGTSRRSRNCARNDPGNAALLSVALTAEGVLRDGRRAMMRGAHFSIRRLHRAGPDQLRTADRTRGGRA